VRISAGTPAILMVFVGVPQSLHTNARVAPKLGYDHFPPSYHLLTYYTVAGIAQSASDQLQAGRPRDRSSSPGRAKNFLS
jgi:hypothetical protein